jgi:hypothetical protein
MRQNGGMPGIWGSNNGSMLSSLGVSVYLIVMLCRPLERINSRLIISLSTECVSRRENSNQKVNAEGIEERKQLRKSLVELGFNENDQPSTEHVRIRFANLAKKYHPDTGTEGEVIFSISLG